MADRMRLTPGETLLIWRRRKGLGQVDAAAELRVHVDRYRAWEADALPKVPTRHTGPVQPHEKCYLMRRRQRPKMTQMALAARLGVTRLWVIQMEDGVAPADRLRNFWKV